MSEVAATGNIPQNWVNQATSNPIEFLQTLDQLLENFGAEDIGNAAAQKFLKSFSEGLKEMIMESDLPDAMKEAAIALIDQHMEDMGVRCSCSDDAADAVENSEVGNEAEQMSQEARAEAESEAANEGTGGAGGASESGGADRAAADDKLDDLMAESAESEDQKKKGGRGKNFLEILADSMGRTQAKFLNEAMKHSKTMESLAGDSERADEFTIA
ncbi:MAG: hypothetical protein KTR32_33465, partial [Granulosicoccus sp.]|nr:hypothetical protein [Granulosicoccus sp.]